MEVPQKLKMKMENNCTMTYQLDLGCHHTVFSSLLQQNLSSQNVQARPQANQVSEEIQETAAERSACDTGQHNIITQTVTDDVVCDDVETSAWCAV